MEPVLQIECADPTRAVFQKYSFLLKECTRLKSLQEGHKVHTHMIMEALDTKLVLANQLVDMYGKCGYVAEALHTFNRIPDHNVYSWMALLSAYNNLGLSAEVWRLYESMCKSVVPDKFVFVTVLNACTSALALDCGQQVHAQMSKLGTEMDAFVQSALVSMYIEGGCAVDAHHIFAETDERNVVLWNAIILGNVRRGLYREAMVLHNEMLQEGVVPDQLTYIGAIQLCASMGLLEKVRRQHMEAVIFDYIADLAVLNTLIDAYTKCGSFQDAWGILSTMKEKDVVSYNVMIATYIQQGFTDKAISIYQQMKQDGLKPNETTFVSIIKACMLLRDGGRGKEFHREILKGGCKLNSFISSALIDMYSKCSMIKDAYEVFLSTEDQNVVVWTAMITGYAQQGFAMEALDLFQRMEQEGVQPNEATIISALKACSTLGAEEVGLQIQELIEQSSLRSNMPVMNSLLEMHASFGSMRKAFLVFNKMLERDVIAWTALIGGYAQQGFVKHASRLFQHMCQDYVKPNAITYLTILSACSHAGLINEGYRYFYEMISKHAIMPTSDHCACLVDLLGRAGHLEEAARVAISMEDQQTELAWRTLLGACKTSSNKSLARFALERIIELNPYSDAAYVLFSSTDDTRTCFWPLEGDALWMTISSKFQVDMSFLKEFNVLPKALVVSAG